MSKDEDEDKLSDFLESLGYTDEDFDGDVDWYDVDLYEEEMKIVDEIVHPTNRKSNFDDEEEEFADDNDDDSFSDEDDYDEDDSDDDDYDDDDYDDDENGCDGDFAEGSNSSADDGDLCLNLTFSVGSDDSDEDEDDEFGDRELTKIEERRKDAKQMLSYYSRQKKLDKKSLLEMKRCQFICSGKALASDYCDYRYGFSDFREAILDRYPLSKEFLEFYQYKIGDSCYEEIVDYDIGLAVPIWVWLMEQFGPYADLDENIIYSITSLTIGRLDWNGEKGVGASLYTYVVDHQDFFFDLCAKMTDIFPQYDSFIFTALQEKNLKFARKLIDVLINDNRWKLSEKFEIIKGVSLSCKYSGARDEQELFVYFVLPMLENIENKVAQKKIKEWLDEFSEYVDISSEKLRQCCTEETVWRLKYRNDGFNPIKYATEEEYLEAKRLEEENDRKREIELEKLTCEVDKVLKEIDEKGDYVSVSDDEKARYYDIAFEQGKHTYNVLCEKIVEKNGELRHLDGGIIVGKISSENIVQVYMLTLTTGLIRKYLDEIACPDRLSENDLCCNRINKELIEFVISRVRSAKLMYLEAKAQEKEIGYYENPILKNGHSAWRNSEVGIREEAKLLYADFVAPGEIQNRWIWKQKMFGIIRHYYRNAIFHYKAEWLEDQSLDVYISSLDLGFEYRGEQHNKSVEQLDGKEEFDKQKQRDEVKKARCESHGVKLVYWECNEPIDDATFFLKLQNAMK